MLKRFLPAALALCATFAAWAGPLEKTPVPTALYDPLDHWEFDLESGALFRVGGNGSDLNYLVLPQMLTWKSPTTFRLGKIAGGDLVMRHRMSLLIEPIVEGPESYYLGVAGSGIIEWWNAERTFSLFFSAGGGVGWMDSQGYEVEGAQGQDFNFNWFLYSGARWMCWDRVSVSLGLYYQHVSNTGLDEVNPGLDALGPMVSVGWHF
jgi:lipid A 3-O-deacylase